MESTDTNARIAGLLYAISIIVGFVTLMYLPDYFVVRGNAAATAHMISSHEMLFRLAITGDLITGVIWLAVVLALYRLLRPVDQVQSFLMLILGALLQVPLYFVNSTNYVAALLLIRGDGALAAVSATQRDAIAMLFLRLHNYEFIASLVFAGLWLFPFGILICKSGFLPRLLGWWVVAAGVAWLITSFAIFLIPQYANAIGRFTQPLTLGEVAIALWLLVMGARPSFTSRALLRSNVADPL